MTDDSATQYAAEQEALEVQSALAMKAGLGVIAVALLLALGGGYLLFSGGRGAPADQQVHPVLTVAVATPRRESWPDTLAASGVIAPWEEASIGTQIGSYQLVEVRANVGDEVRRGQVLARLNPALLQAEEAQLVARHEQAAVNNRRAQALRAAGGISDQDALQAATEAKTTAALLSAKRLELRYTSILAPDDGAISARTATLGAVVPAGQELFRMIRRNRLEWRGELTAVQLQQATRGQNITLQLPDGSAATATLRQIAPSLDSGSRLAIVYADLRPGSRARAGMYVAGDIAVGERPGLMVPAECVVIRDGRSYVMIVTPARPVAKIERRAVTTGRRKGDMVEILFGLSGAERLASRGAAFLDDGDAVRVTAERPARP